MPQTRITVPNDDEGGAPAIAGILSEFGVETTFPSEVEEAVAAAVGRQPGADHPDRRDLPLVTIDPPGSRDLDQALHIDTTADGWRVHYAIADVGWWVRPGDPLDVEARRRGMTVYAADRRAPLYPPALSEGAASLLPGEERAALLWQIDLDRTGEPTEWSLGRALVRSREQLTYAEAQERVAGPFRLLATVGRQRAARERERGGVHLPSPEQEVERTGTGWQLSFRAPLPVEDWNAQISLLTGMCAARTMLDSGVGLLRTLPPPTPGAVESLRRSAAALGVEWPAEVDHAAWLRELDPAEPRHAALVTLATRLLRGAGYIALGGTSPAEGAATVHSAIAAPYAHVTAPLRRLADRYANEVLLAVFAGRPVDVDVLAALPDLPGLMGGAAQRQSAVERAVLDHVEAVVLLDRVGTEFDAAVVEVSNGGDEGVVQLVDPEVRAPVEGPGLKLGERLRVRLEEADPVSRRVRFRPA